MNEEEEIWKRCPGYENFYDISNLGNVRSYHIGRGRVDRSAVKRIMAIGINKDYLQVPLSKGIGVMKTCSIHIMVAKAFVPNPKNRKCVHHKNNDKSDPRAENLEWVTSGQNQKYAYLDGQRERPLGMANGRCKLSIEDVLEIFESKENVYKDSANYNISRKVIASIKSGKLWSSVTGKVYIKKPITRTILSEAQILDILNSKKFQDDLAIQYKVSQSTISAIKTGKSYSELTGVSFTGRKEYEYFGIINKIA